MGTPDFAAVSLEALVAAGHEVCGVLTQPDKPRNRNKVTYSAVKEAALAHGIPVYQPITAKDEATQKLVEDLAPELTVVVAYGQILPQKLLDVPKYGSINVHASLLPKYRGAAPIQWAVLDGEAETGVSIMYMTRRLDAGDVISTARTAIGAEETAPELWGASGRDHPTPGGRDGLPDAPGRVRLHLRPHADEGHVPGGLEPPRQRHPLPDPGPAALALRHRRDRRPELQALPLGDQRRDRRRAGNHPAGGQAGHRDRLRRLAEPSRPGAPG